MPEFQNAFFSTQLFKRKNLMFVKTVKFKCFRAYKKWQKKTTPQLSS